MAEVEWHGSVGLRKPGNQGRRDILILNIRLRRPTRIGKFHNVPAATIDILVAKFVVLVFELQRILGPIASTLKLKAVARLALGLRLVAFNSPLLTCQAASGASAIDHCDILKREILLR